MNRKLITFGFLRMMLPPAPSRPLADPVTAATLDSRTEDAKRNETGAWQSGEGDLAEDRPRAEHKLDRDQRKMRRRTAASQ